MQVWDVAGALSGGLRGNAVMQLPLPPFMHATADLGVCMDHRLQPAHPPAQPPTYLPLRIHPGYMKREAASRPWRAGTRLPLLLPLGPAAALGAALDCAGAADFQTHAPGGRRSLQLLQRAGAQQAFPCWQLLVLLLHMLLRCRLCCALYPCQRYLFFCLCLLL